MQRSLQNHCSQTGCVFKPPPVLQLITNELSFQRDFSSMPAALSFTNQTLLQLFAEKNLEQKHNKTIERVSHIKSPAKVVFDIADGGIDGNDGNGDDEEIGTADAMECVEHLQNHKNSHFQSMKWNLPPPMIA